MKDNRDGSDDEKDVVRHTHPKPASEILYLPVDHGWAWLVMFGAFMNIFCIMMFIRSTSILFIQFLETYQESATMTTLAFGLCSAMFAISNILGPTVLLKKFEVRTMAITGSVINCIGIFFIAFAPNIIVLDVLMGVLGFSHGLISVPQMTLIGQYFNKRLSFATAFVSLGLSIPTIAGPPLVQFLLDTYGLRGSMLILAGINFNCIPSSMLFRPVSRYAKADLSVCLEDNEDEVHKEDKEHEVDLYKEDIKENIYEQKDLKPEEESVSLIRSTTHMKPPMFRSISESASRNTSKVRSVSIDISPAAFAKSDVSIKMSNRRESMVSDFIDMLSVASSIRYLSEAHVFTEDFASKDSVFQHNEHATTDDVSLNSMIPDLNKVYSKDISLKSVSFESPKEASDSNVTFLSKIRKSASESIYTHPLAILLLVASGFGVHTQASISYMPAAGKENGLTDDQIPYLVTIVGASDLISKILIGIFADLGYVKRIHIACVSEIFVGILLQFVGFFEGFGLMILLQVGIGLTIGVMHVMVAVIIVDTLGVKHMGHIMAGYFLVNGFVITVDHLVIGTLKDFTGSFIMAYNYIGSLILLSAFLLLLEPLVARLKPAPKS